MTLKAAVTILSLAHVVSSMSPATVILGEWKLQVIESTYSGYFKEPVNATMMIEKSAVFDDIIVGKLDSEREDENNALEGIHGMYIRVGQHPNQGSLHIEEEDDHQASDDDEESPDPIDIINFDFTLRSHLQRYRSSGSYAGKRGEGTFIWTFSEDHFILHLQNSDKTRVTSWIAHSTRKVCFFFFFFFFFCTDKVREEIIHVLFSPCSSNTVCDQLI